jgi:hypothetical protein
MLDTTKSPLALARPVAADALKALSVVSPAE